MFCPQFGLLPYCTSGKRFTLFRYMYMHTYSVEKFHGIRVYCSVELYGKLVPETVHQLELSRQLISLTVYKVQLSGQ